MQHLRIIFSKRRQENGFNFPFQGKNKKLIKLPIYLPPRSIQFLPPMWKIKRTHKQFSYFFIVFHIFNLNFWIHFSLFIYFIFLMRECFQQKGKKTLKKFLFFWLGIFLFSFSLFLCFYVAGDDDERLDLGWIFNYFYWMK